jgi:hypothetical protein
MPRPGLLIAVGLASSVGLTCFLGAGTAQAGTPLPVPALAQYIETMPTSDGPAVVAVAKPHVRKLPAAIEHKVTAEGGSDAPVIRQIATSSAYGAPQTTLERPKVAKGAGRPPTGAPAAAPHPKPETSPDESASQPQTYATDGSSDWRALLLAGLLAIVTASLAIVARRVRDEAAPPAADRR